MERYTIKKTFTNNAVYAVNARNEEVILLGKGIGFGKTRDDIVDTGVIESVFVLSDQYEQSLYIQVLKTTSAKLADVVSELILYIQQSVEEKLNEHICVSLTDHITFLVKRIKLGVPINNPFLVESSILYPKETEIANELVKMLQEKLKIKIPQDEVGFMALHIVTAVSASTLENLQQEQYIFNLLIQELEKQLGIKVNKEELNYARLVTHIRFMIKRVKDGEILTAPGEMVENMQRGYTECYKLAARLANIVGDCLHKEVEESEIFYLSLHLYRFIAGGF